jgi:hypothetical protein
MSFYKWHHVQIFLWKLRQPVVNINNVATCLIVMYLYTFVTTVVYEKKDIYIPNSSNLLLNLVIFILYKESYIRRKGRSDYMIFYSSFYLDNAE